MADNRDPRKKSRTRRQLRTSSSERSVRSKASAKDTPRPTSSTDRAKQQGKGSRKVTTGKGQQRVAPRGAQGPATPPVQGPNRKVSGIIGTRKGSTALPTKAAPTPGNKISSFKPKPKATNAIKPTRLTPRGGGRSAKGSGVKNTLLAGMAAALATGALRNPVSKAKKAEAKKKTAKVIDNYNTKDADGTVRSRKKVGPAKVGPKKVGPGKVGTQAQSFDKAFAAARSAGKSVFTWKGKKFNTKTK